MFIAVCLGTETTKYTAVGTYPITPPKRASHAE